MTTKEEQYNALDGELIDIEEGVERIKVIQSIDFEAEELLV